MVEEALNIPYLISLPFQITQPPSPMASSSSTSFLSPSSTHQPFHLSPFSLNSPLIFSLKNTRSISQIHVSSSTNNPTISPSSSSSKNPSQETVFFDGGAHYGDLVANLLLGFTLLWLPLTLASVFRAFSLRYRFSNLRVTVISGMDRSDFSYKVIKDVQVVPRFIGEWGDVVITLQDGTKVDLRSVPKFREIAKYCLSMAGKSAVSEQETGPKGF